MKRLSVSNMNLSQQDEHAWIGYRRYGGLSQQRCHAWTTALPRGGHLECIQVIALLDDGQPLKGRHRHFVFAEHTAIAWQACAHPRWLNELHVLSLALHVLPDRSSAMPLLLCIDCCYRGKRILPRFWSRIYHGPSLSCSAQGQLAAGHEKSIAFASFPVVREGMLIFGQAHLRAEALMLPG